MEKILEKSGKSQGILSVRKSGNPDEQTHTCENITFPQLRLQALIYNHRIRWCAT